MEKEEEKKKDDFGEQDEGPYSCLPEKNAPCYGKIECVNKIGVFTFFLCLAVLLQCGVNFGLIPICVSTLEKRFGFESWMTGFMIVFSEIAFVASAVTITKSWTATVGVKNCVCMVILGFGCIFYSLPHFLTDNYSYPGMNNSASDGDDFEFCVDEPLECVENEQNLQWWLAMFVLGQIFIGIGSVPLHTVSMAFIETSCPPGKGAIYFALVRACTALGPLVGYLGGAISLSTWVDFDTVEKPDNIEPGEPQWVGAWWPGILAAGIGCIFVGPFFFGFPRQIPGTAEIKKKRVVEIEDGDSSAGEANLMSVVKNPIFLLCSFGSAFDAPVKTGLMNFGPKIIEVRFHVTAANSAVASGIVCVPGALLGSIFGGVVIKCMKLSGRGIMIFSTIAATLAAFFYAWSAFLSCGQPELVGVTSPYPNNVFVQQESVSHFGLFDHPSNYSVKNECNDDCHCIERYYFPTCIGKEDPVTKQFVGKTYFSPCHAGCAESQTMPPDEDNPDGYEMYFNCACAGPEEYGYMKACDKEQEEEDECSAQYLQMLIISFFTIFFEFLTDVTAPIAILRAVGTENKGLALGLMWVIIKAFGNCWAPIVAGKFMDKSCVIWSTTECAGMLSLPLTFKIINIFLYALAAYKFQELQKPEDGKFDKIEKEESALENPSFEEEKKKEEPKEEEMANF
ncbi:Oidioi.mRNA.OKI2018_I69.chr1.g395.t1.cds [Oikopleura dioica]|uniref:Solute carrier organic anion transporter family member n=1 Tax=Oikopleura dioica TaxID=34765 RepID=A0ABN7SJP1_OIKDI|nr:Oidioi.mRNA.OKI2018_I69.chr1.g395.t1.cds [Oikopleura dioica]